MSERNKIHPKRVLGAGGGGGDNEAYSLLLPLLLFKQEEAVLGNWRPGCLGGGRKESGKTVRPGKCAAGRRNLDPRYLVIYSILICHLTFDCEFYLIHI